ncbi:MAG: hypothetical protein V4659_06005 [Pseudomonadota bacterium]
MSPALVRLRETLGVIEGQRVAVRPALPFGISALDQRLGGGGLRIDALHEVAAARAGWGDDAPATLFMAGVAARSSGPILWIVRGRDLFAPGLYQAGLTPERLIYAEARDDAEMLARITPGTPCPAACPQGTQIVPVVGNNDRPVPVYFVRHGDHYLDVNGNVTTTPVRHTFAEAADLHDTHKASR